jgi:hypothetical protein
MKGCGINQKRARKVKKSSTWGLSPVRKLARAWVVDVDRKFRVLIYADKL